MWSFFTGSLWALAVLFAALLPWGVVLGGAIFGVRYVRRRYLKRDE